VIVPQRKDQAGSNIRSLDKVRRPGPRLAGCHKQATLGLLPRTWVRESVRLSPQHVTAGGRACPWRAPQERAFSVYEFPAKSQGKTVPERAIAGKPPSS
jgi:hypothetical protein